jgi:hypothetical protein
VHQDKKTSFFEIEAASRDKEANHACQPCCLFVNELMPDENILDVCIEKDADEELAVEITGGLEIHNSEFARPLNPCTASDDSETGTYVKDVYDLLTHRQVMELTGKTPIKLRLKPYNVRKLSTGKYEVKYPVRNQHKYQQLVVYRKQSSACHVSAWPSTVRNCFETQAQRAMMQLRDRADKASGVAAFGRVPDLSVMQLKRNSDREIQGHNNDSNARVKVEHGVEDENLDPEECEVPTTEWPSDDDRSEHEEDAVDKGDHGIGSLKTPTRKPKTDSTDARAPRVIGVKRERDLPSTPVSASRAKVDPKTPCKAVDSGADDDDDGGSKNDAHVTAPPGTPLHWIQRSTLCSVLEGNNKGKEFNQLTILKPKTSDSDRTTITIHQENIVMCREMWKESLLNLSRERRNEIVARLAKTKLQWPVCTQIDLVR